MRIFIIGNPETYETTDNAVPVDQRAVLVELQRLAHDKMKNLLRTRTLRGFPLNVPFTDVEELLTRVGSMHSMRLLLLCCDVVVGVSNLVRTLYILFFFCGAPIFAFFIYLSIFFNLLCFTWFVRDHQIKTMCIHEAKHPEVQFVMAVRAFPLYNNILSLWVFLGTLEPVAH